MKTIKFFLVFALAILSTVSIAKPGIILEGNPYLYAPDVVVIQRVIMNANNISAYFQNTGIFDQNTSTSNTAGFEWPKGSGKTAMFTAGLCIACGINGQYAQVMASYKGEYAPGKIVNGVFYTDSDFKIYSVKAGDSAQSNPDYANWYKMIPYGAPYEDVNNNGIYDNGIDKPGMKNAAQTIFEVMTDMDITQHSPGEGFGGGITNPLLKAEIAWTSWVYTNSGLENVQFSKWRIINKGTNIWDSTFIGLVSDPDLGDPLDDYIGCDTTLDLGYCYNSDNNDGVYGTAPPAVGIDLFRGAIKKNTGSASDTLGMTSFCYFTDIGSNPPPCESDPNGAPTGAYHFLQGLKKDRTPFMDITKTPPQRTKYCFSGDPFSNTGWTESKGSMNNCNGDTTGPIIYNNPGGDRRFVLGTGRVDFRVLPNDTQTVVIGQMIARGTNYLNSITLLKSLSHSANLLYNLNFSVPVINLSTEVPDKYNLHQNYPNPFNPATKIKFDIPRWRGVEGWTSLKIYDITGREIETLVNERLQPGTYELTFDGSNLTSGVYFYQLVTSGFTETRRMLLIK